MAVHLDVNGANGRTISHHTDIAYQVLDRVAGEQSNAVFAADPSSGEKRGNLPGQPPQLSVADRSPVIDGDNVGLVRIALCRAIDPVSKQFRSKLSFVQHETS